MRVTEGDGAKELSQPRAEVEESAAGLEAKPYFLGEALPVVPQKLVRRITRGEYVNMAELLKENLEAERRRALRRGGVTVDVPHQASEKGGPRHNELASVLQHVCGSHVCQQPGKDQGDVGLSGPHDWRGQEVWWPGLATL